MLEEVVEPVTETRVGMWKWERWRGRDICEVSFSVRADQKAGFMDRLERLIREEFDDKAVR